MPSGRTALSESFTKKNSSAIPQSADRVSVLLPMPFDKPFDYALPTGMTLAPGDVVLAPLGPRELTGVVWDRETESDDPELADKIKPIAAKLDFPPLPSVTRQFIAWVARYTMAPVGQVLRMAIGAPSLVQPLPTVTAFRLGTVQPPRMTSARERVLALLADGPARTAKDIELEAGVSAGVIVGLRKSGALVAVELPANFGAGPPVPDPDHLRDDEVVQLSDMQSKAVANLVPLLGDEPGDGRKARQFSCTLLEGVTGSGKTEVYFEMMAEALRRNPEAQILVMVPEIALTNQLLSRFEVRFGEPPVAWHSGLSLKQRRQHLRWIADGSARVVVGARSALMLPFPALGLIIVDEEHDGSYKQEEQIIYHARDMAVVRASLGQLPIVLVSATPSLETVSNCEQGRYGRVVLPERHGGALLPEVTAIDMRTENIPRGRWLSPGIVEEIGNALEAGEQSLLFLNRRGYAPAAICRACGHRLQREGCSAPLVVHRYGKRLQCHHCNYSTPMPSACPSCGAEASIVVCGPGVERLAEEAVALFPEARIGVMASDTVRTAADVQAFITQIERHEIDIVIGTQLVSKGHHFPMLTLVGIIDADLGLSGGDLRAAERTYQQLWQVAGRAGRGERPGRVLMQTYMPEHPVMQALVAGDGPGFYAREADARKEWQLPPFGRLAAVILSGRNSTSVNDVARELSRSIPSDKGVIVMGPAPAPFAILRGRHRLRFLVKSAREYNIQDFLRRWLPDNRQPKGVRITIDIDPYSFL